MSNEIPMTAKPKVVTKVLSNQSATKTDYQSRGSFLKALEGESRSLFSKEQNVLKRWEATSYLKGEENNTKALELIVSPKDTELFRYLGKSEIEREENLARVTRQAMDTILKDLGADSARWVAAYHQNTDQNHLHILIGESYQDEEGKLQSLKRLPKDFLVKNEEGYSKLDLAFSKALREQIELTPENVPTILVNTNDLPIADNKRTDEIVTDLLEKNAFSANVINQAIENGSIVPSENAEAMFVRRNAEGIVTGANRVNDNKSWNRTSFHNGGWFYIGDPNKAESIILVSSPEEALALQSSHSQRDLRKVAIIALEPRRLDQELANLLLSRQKTLNTQNQDLNVVWATNSTRNGRQYSNGLRELKNYLKENSKAENISEITFKNYQRDTSWVNYSRKYAEIKEVQQIMTESEINVVSLPQDIPFTPTLPALPELLNPPQNVEKVEEIQTSETLNYQITKRDIQKEAEAAVKKQLANNPNPSRDEARLIYQEITRKVKDEISMEAIASRMGYTETRYNGENVWTDSSQTKRIKISGELFSDRKNGMRGGKGTIDFVSYLQDLPKSSSFKEARQWLVDNFNVSYTSSPTEINEIKKPTKVEKLPLQMSPMDGEKTDRIRYFLEAVRGINSTTIDKLLDNGTLYANSYGSPVFVHRDLDGHITGGSWRDTRPGITRRGNEKGTDKEKGCYYLGNPKTAERFVLVEAPIDALSYYDLEQVNGVDLSKTAIISIGGSSTPKFLTEFLVKRQIELELENQKFEVIFGTDNDRAGELAFEKFLNDFEEAAPTLLENGLDNEKLYITRQVPPTGKDWNDYLILENNQPDYPSLEELNTYRQEQKLDPTSEEVLPETEVTKDLRVSVLNPELVLRHHSVTNKPLFIVDLKTRVPFDTYQELEIKAEAFQGFFQKGYKPADVPGGFRFADEKTALEFIDQIKGTQFAFSRLVQEQANQIINELPEGYAEARAKYNELIRQKENPEEYFESEEFAIIANYLNDLSNGERLEQNKPDFETTEQLENNQKGSELEDETNFGNQERISPRSMGDNGERISGGISTAAIPDDAIESDFGQNLSDDEFESNGNISLSNGAESTGIGSDGISTGDIAAVDDDGLGSGGDGGGTERQVSGLDQTVRLENEETFRLKLRSSESPEFLEYKFGFNPVTKTWITTATGLVGSKHQEAKKVDYFELNSESSSLTKLESLTLAIQQINDQIGKFDNPEDEFAPLYADIYRHNKDFLSLFEENPVIKTPQIVPSDIKKVVHLDQGFKVIFNDERFTRSFNIRKGDGSRELRTAETVREEAAQWRSDCEKRERVINDKAEYLKNTEGVSLYSNGNNRISTNLYLDKVDGLWRGTLAINLTLKAEKLIVRDKPISFLNNGFETREELLANLSSKAIEKIENRASYTKSETKKMFQDVISELQSKQAQFLKLDVEFERNGENEKENENQRQSEEILGESWNRSEQGFTFRREETGEIIIRQNRAGNRKESEVTLAQIAGIKGFEEIVESTFDFWNKSQTNEKLWFAKKEEIGKPLFTLTDKIIEKGDYVVIAERSKNSFDLNKQHNLTDLRRINLAAAKNAELIAFDEQIDAIQIQSVKGEIFYSALVREISDNLYQNSFGLLEEDAQMEVLNQIEQTFAAFGYDGISNTIRVNAEKINKIRAFSGNWQAVGQYQTLGKQSLENQIESEELTQKAYILEEETFEESGTSKINEIFKFNSLGEGLSDVHIEVLPNKVYLLATETEINQIINNIQQDYGLGLSFVESLDENEKTYIQAINKPDFELSQEQYIQKRIWQAGLGYEAKILSLQGEIDEIENLDRQTASHKVKLRELNTLLEFNSKSLIEGKHKTDVELERFAREYEISVARDIKKGLVAPERRKELAETSIFLKTSVQNRERKEKSELNLIRKAEEKRIEQEVRAVEIAEQVNHSASSQEITEQIQNIQLIFSGQSQLKADELILFSEWLDESSADMFIEKAEKAGTEIPQILSKRGNQQTFSLTEIKHADQESNNLKKLIREAELSPIVPFLRSETTPRKIFNALTVQYLSNLNGIEPSEGQKLWNDDVFKKLVPAIESEILSRLNLINQEMGLAPDAPTVPQLEAEQINQEIQNESRVIENPEFYDLFIDNTQNIEFELGMPKDLYRVLGYTQAKEVVLYEMPANPLYGVAYKTDEIDMYIHQAIFQSYSEAQKSFVKTFQSLEKDEKSLAATEVLLNRLKEGLGNSWAIEELLPDENYLRSFAMRSDDTQINLYQEKNKFKVFVLDRETDNWGNEIQVSENFGLEVDSVDEFITRVNKNHLFDQESFIEDITEEIESRAEIFDFELNPDRELVRTEFVKAVRDDFLERVKVDFRYQYLKPETIEKIYYDLEAEKIQERKNQIKALENDTPVKNYTDIPLSFDEVEKRDLPSNVVPTIGFTNEYYTLWYVVETQEGERFCEYVQNLSTDLETAKAKVAEKFEHYEVDLVLRGAEQAIGNDGEAIHQGKYADYEFHFGKLAGQDIRESEDVWQLNRARQFEFQETTREFAHKRMFEMGELHQINDEWFTSDQIITKAEQVNEVNGWHLSQGDRPTLELTVKHTSWFETVYGASAIQIFRDADNRIYKYLGSSPIQAEKGEIVTAKGTIEHSNYNGVNETRLKRLAYIPSDEKRYEDRKVTLEEAFKILNLSSENLNDNNLKEESSKTVELNQKDKLNSLTDYLIAQNVKKRDFVELNQISGQILYNLEFRVMEFETIPQDFISNIAQSANLPESVLEEYLKLPNRNAGEEKISFAQAIIEDEGLKFELKEQYMKLLQIKILEKESLSEIQAQKASMKQQTVGFVPTGSEFIPTELNENEHQVFISLGQQILDSTGGEFGYAGDAQIPEGMTERQFSGYVSQLTQKDYFVIANEYKQLMISEKFENYANHHNLFVGESFSFGWNQVAIQGTPEPQVIEPIKFKFDYPDNFHANYTEANGFTQKTITGKIGEVKIGRGFDDERLCSILVPAQGNAEVNYFLKFKEEDLEVNGNFDSFLFKVGQPITFNAYILKSAEERSFEKGSGNIPTNVLSLELNLLANENLLVQESQQIEQTVELVTDENYAEEMENMYEDYNFPLSDNEYAKEMEGLYDSYDFKNSPTDELVPTGSEFIPLEQNTIEFSYSSDFHKSYTGEDGYTKQTLKGTITSIRVNPAPNHNYGSLTPSPQTRNDLFYTIRVQTDKFADVQHRIIFGNEHKEAEVLLKEKILTVGSQISFTAYVSEELEESYVKKGKGSIPLEILSISYPSKEIKINTQDNVYQKVIQTLSDLEQGDQPNGKDIQEILFDDLLYSERQRTGFFASYLNSKIGDRLTSKNINTFPLYDAAFANDLSETEATDLALRIERSIGETNIVILFNSNKVSVLDEKELNLDKDSLKEFQNLEQAVEFIANYEAERVLTTYTESTIAKQNKESGIVDFVPIKEKQFIEFGSKLLPNRLLNQLPVRQTRETSDEYDVHFKLFHPMSSWTMFITEAEAIKDDQNNVIDVNLFGFVHTDGINDEWGYSSLREIQETNIRGVGVERDLYFNPGKFGDVWQQFQSERGMLPEETAEIIQDKPIIEVPVIKQENVAQAIADIKESAEATIEENRLNEVFEPQDIEQLEKDAYNEYVSQGYGDSDGYFAPLAFENWQNSYLNPYQKQTAQERHKGLETLAATPVISKTIERLDKELLFETVEITFTESTEFDNGKIFSSVQEFDEFLAKTPKPDDPQLYYKTDFIAHFSDGSQFKGRVELQQGSEFNLRNLIVEDLESAKSVLTNFENSVEEKFDLESRIELNERFLSVLPLKESNISNQYTDFSQFLPTDITNHIERNNRFSINRRDNNNARIQVERFITETENSINITKSLDDGTEKQIIFAYDEKTKQFSFDKLLTSEKGIIIDKSDSFEDAQEIVNSLDFVGQKKTQTQSNQYTITGFEEYSEGGLKTKFKRNVEAVKLLNQLEYEQRLATSEEQEVLARFSGWGGLKDAFDIYRPKPEWKKEIAELAALYEGKESEYFEARLSSENAHYTSPEVSQKMWQIVQKLGFDGGRVLEPAAGVGNFIGLIPEELQNKTSITAVEKEETSAAITKQLYQKSRVINSAFENANIADESFDLVISNFPFGQFTVNDPNYNALKPSIHDYFFLKSLDKVREGGLVVALTSRFTLDKKETEIREGIARRAELVGAYRLPDTAFKSNAKTEVVTDLLIFQKRTAENLITKEEIKDLNWVTTDLMEIEPQEKKRVNQYYFENSENIFGKFTLEGRMYAGNELTVKVDSKEQMLEHFDRVIENIKPVYQKSEISREYNQPTGLSFEQIDKSKEGSILVTPKNEIFQIVKGREVKLEKSKADAEKTIALVGIKEKVKEIFTAEVNNESAEVQREELNSLYNGFYQKYGIINSQKTLALLDGDPEAYLVKTLENYANEKTNKAEKASIFFESTLRGYSPPEEVENINDAIAISLNEYARLDIPRISSLLKVPEEEVEKQFSETKRAYFNHETEDWEISEKYLSGNVKEKLNLVMEFAALSEENQAKVQNNLDALIEIQPKELTYTEIEANLGASWIPPKDIKDFLIHLTKSNSDAIRVERSVNTGQWSVSWSGNASSRHSKKNEASTKIWGTERVDTLKIAQCILDGRPVHVTDPEEIDGKEVKVTNREETEKGNQKLKEIQLEFKDWIWSDADRRQRLCRTYNEIKNTTVERQYDGSHLTLPNTNPLIELRPHQKNAIWRAMQESATYMAHDPGAGKTIVLGAALIEKKRLGQVKKPLLTCMKANIKQITAEIQKLYPTAKIFSGENGFDADSRKTAISNIATNNHDLIILTYNQMDEIPFSMEFKKNYISSELQDVNGSLAVAFEAEGKKSKMVSRLNKRVNSLEAQISKLVMKRREEVVTFEETGIDYVGVDEAHNFVKGLPIYTTMNNVKGVPNSRSERGVNMHMRSQYFNDKYGEVRMVMGSGTPITNSIAESYNLMRMLMPDELKRQGIYSFDDFARDYTKVVSKIEPTITGAYKEQSRMAEFINAPELRQLMGNVLDVVKADDAGIVRPTRKDIVVSVPISDEQIEFRKALHQRASIMHNVDPREDNYLKLMNDGRLMSIDMRLVDENAEDNPNSKVNYLVSNVLKIAKENPKSTQLIFSNLGIAENKKTGHSVFQDIIEKLEDGGIPRDRIANFSDLSDKKRKEAIDKLNTGEILVALGSTDTLGTGVNAQKFIKAGHNLDVPWLPSAIEQRDARSVRFGNIFADMGEDVEINRYVTQGTFDSIGWDTIRRKTEFINQIVTNKLAGTRHFQEPDAEEFTASQISAIASGNPDVLRKIELSDEVKQYSDMETRHKQIALELADTIPGKESFVAVIEKEKNNLVSDYELYKTNRLEDGDKFKVNLLGEDYTDYEDVSKILSREMMTCSGRKEIGKFCGFNVVVELQSGIGWSLRHPVVALESPNTNNGYRFKTDDSFQIATSMAGHLAHLKTQAEVRERTLAKEQRELDDIKLQVNKPFRFAEELKNSQTELKEVEARLRDWNQEQAAEQEKKAELKIEILTNSIDEEAKEIQSQKIFDSLTEINETRPKFEYPAFISKEDTEATIRGVEITELSNYRTLENELEDEELDREVTLFDGLEEDTEIVSQTSAEDAQTLNQITETKKQPKAEKINVVTQGNLLFGQNTEEQKISEEVPSENSEKNNDIDFQEEVKLDEKDIAVLKGQLILAQAELKVLERDQLIQKLTAYQKTFEVFNDKQEIVDRREFIELGSTGKQIYEAKDADNYYKWSLEDVLIAKETFAQSLYEIGNEEQREWSLSSIKSTQYQLEKALGSTEKEEQREQHTEERQREFLNSLIDNEINPVTITENYLNSLKPEGIVRNIESKFNFNPLAKLEKHPLIRIGKALYEISETQAKEEFLKKTQFELKEKIEKLEEIENNVREQIKFEKENLSEQISAQKEQIKTIADEIVGPGMPEETIKAIKPEITAEELDNLATMAIKSSNIGLMRTYQQQVLENMVTLNLKTTEFQERFEQKFDRATVYELSQVQAEPVSEVLKEELAKVFGSLEQVPDNMLEAYEKIDKLNNLDLPTKIIQMAQENSVKHLEGVDRMNLFAEDEMLSHFKGQNLVAEAFEQEMRQRFLPMTTNPAMAFTPKMEAAQLIQSANDFKKAMNNFGDSFSQKLGVDYQDVQPMASTQEVNLLNDEPEDSFKVRIFDVEITPEAFADKSEMDKVQNHIGNKLEQNAQDLAADLEKSINAANQQLAEIKKEVIAKAAVTERSAAEFLAL